MDVIPPDPYQALGLPRAATSAAIKTTYRKLALKCHPDKVEGKGDEFFKIQQAYEILGDDTRRQQYDDETRLAELRREMFGRRNGGSMPNVEIRTASFDVRSSPKSTGATFNAKGPTRMADERRNSAPKTSYDDVPVDDYFGSSRSNSRKYDGRPQPRSTRSGEYAADVKPEKMNSREKERERLEKERERLEKERERLDRLEREKMRTRERNQERGRTHQYVDDDTESSASDEKRQEPVRRRYDENDRSNQYDRPRTEQRSSDENLYYDKLQSQQADVKNYISRSKAEAVASPYTDRASPPPSSYHQRPQEQYDARRSSNPERPSLIRRTSTTRHKEKPIIAEPPPRLSRRESVSRRSPEHDVPSRTASTRRPPPLTTAQSSPANIKLPSPVDDPRRSRTDYLDRPAPQPRMQRADTMPSKPTVNSRTAQRPRDAVPTVGSGLRHSETHDSGYSTSSPSGTPPQQPQWGFQQATAPPTSYKQSAKFYNESPVMVEEPIEYGTNTRPSTTLREPAPRDRTERSTIKNPPLSRSASYAHHGPPPPPSADRASSRERSKTTTSGSVRRPGLERSNSSRASTKGVPTLSRGATTPLPPLKTPGMAAGPSAYFAGGVSGIAPQYFDDANVNVRSASPQDMYNRTEAMRPSRKTSGIARDDNGYGQENPWDDDPSFVPPRMKRASTFDTNPGLSRSGTVREARDPRDSTRYKESTRDRERERERDRELRERDVQRERERGYAAALARERERERPRGPVRRSATNVY